MRCKKHLTDLSSSVGVCATCLRDRLFALIAAQVQAQARAQAEAQTQAAVDDHRKSDTIPPPLIFPRSVSPYITRRKSDTATVNASTTATWHHHQHLRLPDQKFFSTPQLGPTGAAITASVYKKKNSGKFSLISKLFRSKSVKPGTDLDPRVSDSGETCTASSSPAWFSTILPGRKKNQTRTFSLDETAIRGQRKTSRNRDRGMSPAMYSDDEEDNEHCHPGSSGYSSESSQGWKQTPRRTPANQRRGGGRPNHSRNVSGIAFCLSPLVRASPSRFWNQKGVVPPDVVVPGQSRPPVKPHLTSGMSFCKNRSKKLADFGRFSRNH